MKSESFKCDVCQVEKTASNHWFKGYLIDAGELNSPMASVQKSAGIMIIPWDVKTFSTPFKNHGLPEADAHLCGEQHAIQWANQQLSRKG